MKMEFRKIGRVWIFGILVIIGVCWFVSTTGQQFLGDDLSFWGLHDSRKGDPLYFARYWWGLWMSNNGRVGDMLNYPVLYLMPGWMRGMACGVMMMLFYLLPLKIAFGEERGKRRGLKSGTDTARDATTEYGRDGLKIAGASVMILLMMTTFCWWDSMLLFVCQLNYVWAAVFGMIGVILWQKREGKGRWYFLWGIAGFLAGSFHEAMGLPLLGGILVNTWMNRDRKLGAGRIWILTGLIMGVIVSVGSPGLMERLIVSKTEKTADDPMWLLLIKSDFYALLLIVLLIIEMIKNPGRMKNRLKGEWGILVVTAILSMGISGVSGIVGRSGWFAQLFALMALMQSVMAWIGERGEKREGEREGGAIAVRILTGVAGVIVILLAVGSCRWQIQLTGELRDFYREYGDHPAQPVYMNVTREMDLPWWTLRRVRGVPDADDEYYLQIAKRVYGDKIHMPKVLPKELEERDMTKENLPKKIGVGEVRENREGYVRNTAIEEEGVEKMVVPFSQSGMRLVYVEERERDPGDR